MTNITFMMHRLNFSDDYNGNYNHNSINIISDENNYKNRRDFVCELHCNDDIIIEYDPYLDTISDNELNIKYKEKLKKLKYLHFSSTFLNILNINSAKIMLIKNNTKNTFIVINFFNSNFYCNKHRKSTFTNITKKINHNDIIDIILLTEFRFIDEFQNYCMDKNITIKSIRCLNTQQFFNIKKQDPNASLIFSLQGDCVSHKIKNTSLNVHIYFDPIDDKIIIFGDEKITTEICAYYFAENVFNYSHENIIANRVKIDSLEYIYNIDTFSNFTPIFLTKFQKVSNRTQNKPFIIGEKIPKSSIDIVNAINNEIKYITNQKNITFEQIDCLFDRYAIYNSIKYKKIMDEYLPMISQTIPIINHNILRIISNEIAIRLNKIATNEIATNENSDVPISNATPISDTIQINENVYVPISNVIQISNENVSVPTNITHNLQIINKMPINENLFVPTNAIPITNENLHVSNAIPIPMQQKRNGCLMNIVSIFARKNK